MATENINGYQIETVDGDDISSLGSISTATRLFSLFEEGDVTAAQLLALVSAGEGDSASRPSAAANKGRIYNNTELGLREFSDGASWLSLGGGGGGATQLAQLSDVDSTNRADGRILAWDETEQANKYVDPPSAPDLSPYPAATGQPSGKIPQTDGEDGYTFIDTPTPTGGTGSVQDVSSYETIAAPGQTRILDADSEYNLVKLDLEDDLTLEVRNTAGEDLMATVKARAMTGEKTINLTAGTGAEFSDESPTSIVIGHGKSKTFHIDIAEGFKVMVTVMDEQSEFSPTNYFEWDINSMTVDADPGGWTVSPWATTIAQSLIVREDVSFATNDPRRFYIEWEGSGNSGQGFTIDALDAETDLNYELLTLLRYSGTASFQGAPTAQQVASGGDELGYNASPKNGSDLDVHRGNYAVSGYDLGTDPLPFSYGASDYLWVFLKREGDAIWGRAWLYGTTTPADLRSATPADGVKVTDASPHNLTGGTGLTRYAGAGITRICKFYAAYGTDQVPLP